MRGEVVGLRSTTSAGQTGASRPKRLRKSWVDRIEWVEPLSLGREDAARFLELGQLGGPAALLCKDRAVALTTGQLGQRLGLQGRDWSNERSGWSARTSCTAPGMARQ